MSEFDQNTQGENTQNNNGEQASSVYSYSYSDINQGENATADRPEPADLYERCRDRL